MLNARNTVIAVVMIAILSLVSMCVTLMRPPDSGGQAGDSYGTRAQGQRAMFEILTELGVTTERLLVPPTAAFDRSATLVFWRPRQQLIQAESTYLRAVGEWIRSGGRVVVAPDDEFASNDWKFSLNPSSDSVPSLLECLGVPQVRLKSLDLEPAAKVETPTADAANSGPPSGESGHDLSISDDLHEFRELVSNRIPPIPTGTRPVMATGDFSAQLEGVTTLELPVRKLQVLDLGGSTPAGRLTLRDADGAEQTLAALFRQGQGELIIVGSAALCENRVIARQDNSVLATRLLAVPGRPVLFDEFYHGLTLRGNPLWLFTRPGYAVVTLSLLLALGVWIWRESTFLGPRQAEPRITRRSIREYVEAMSRFMSRGRSSRWFMLQEVRDGVLHGIRQELGLPPGREHVEDLASVLARRDPVRARRLVEAVVSVDGAIAGGGSPREQATIQLLQGILNCL